MKTIYKKSLIAIFGAIAYIVNPNISVNASDWDWMLYIEEGTKWKVEVKSKVNADLTPFTVNQWLEGAETINDTSYYKLWSQIEGQEAQVISYIRIDRPYVYALSPNNIEQGEVMIYSYSVLNEDNNPVEIMPINWKGDISDHKYHIKLGRYETLDYSHYNGFEFTAYPTTFYELSDTEYTTPLGTVQWIYGLGTPAGFTNQCYCFDNEWETTLLAVYHLGEQIVYDNTTAGVTFVKKETLADGIKYRPDGSIFNDGDKGIYIMNGKKFIKY